MQAAAIPVSIHAPARGATYASAFQCACAMFQFTRPQGARHCIMKVVNRHKSFNSRARKGRDTKTRPA